LNKFLHIPNESFNIREETTLLEEARENLGRRVIKNSKFMPNHDQWRYSD
jgi:hypothetical protein